MPPFCAITYPTKPRPICFQDDHSPSQLHCRLLAKINESWFSLFTGSVSWNFTVGVSFSSLSLLNVEYHSSPIVCIHKVERDVSSGGYLSTADANKILFLCKRVDPFLDELYNSRHCIQFYLFMSVVAQHGEVLKSCFMQFVLSGQEIHCGAQLLYYTT